jgi:hypothetical protein
VAASTPRLAALNLESFQTLPNSAPSPPAKQEQQLAGGYCLEPALPCLGLASVEQYAMEIICVRGTPSPGRGKPFPERTSCRRHAPAGHLSFSCRLLRWKQGNRKSALNDGAARANRSVCGRALPFESVGCRHHLGVPAARRRLQTC